MKAYVEAYGCTLNFGEARELEDALSAKGWDISKSPDGCDLAVLATCVVIETTERAMLKRIRELSSCPRLIVTGCIATACREKAERVAPKAEFVAPGDLESFSAAVESCGKGALRDAIHRDSYGIVPIASGCLGDCAYCITKLARGKLRSRSLDAVTSGIERIAGSGPREIQLTAQDTAAYGRDIGSDLPTLVENACGIPLDFRLRIGMMNPRSALPLKERLARMYGQKKVFKFLHLPVQSASDDILADMSRGYTVADFRSIVSKVRENVSGLTLSTDLIVGYPGESDDRHRMNLDLISEIQPDIVNVTRFSSRPGTRAASSADQVVGWRAKERSREITELRFSVALEKNMRWLDRPVRALATERGKGKSTILRTDEYKQVVVPTELRLGMYYDVRVVAATPTYLRGELVVGP